jgi:hypothetical protein
MQCIAEIRKTNFEYFLTQFLWLAIQLKVHRICPLEEDDFIAKIFLKFRPLF